LIFIISIAFIEPGHLIIIRSKIVEHKITVLAPEEFDWKRLDAPYSFSEERRYN
jgi:hypothetical protein